MTKVAKCIANGSNDSVYWEVMNANQNGDRI